MSWTSLSDFELIKAEVALCEGALHVGASHAFACALKAGEVTLKEHVAAQWLAVEELDQLDWAAADVPVVSGAN